MAIGYARNPVHSLGTFPHTRFPPPAFFVYVREYPLDAIGTGGVPLAQQNLPPHAPPEQEPLPLAAGGPCASGSGGGIGAKSACWVRMGA